MASEKRGCGMCQGRGYINKPTLGPSGTKFTNTLACPKCVLEFGKGESAADKEQPKAEASASLDQLAPHCLVCGGTRVIVKRPDPKGKPPNIPVCLACPACEAGMSLLGGRCAAENERPCPWCVGAGYVVFRHVQCSWCEGKGRLQLSKLLSMQRPEGATDCPMCDGSGKNPIGGMACVLCEGVGWQPRVSRPGAPPALEGDAEPKTVPPSAERCGSCEGKGERVIRVEGQSPMGPERCDDCEGKGWVVPTPEQLAWRGAVHKVRSDVTPEAAARMMALVEDDRRCGEGLWERCLAAGHMMVRRFSRVPAGESEESLTRAERTELQQIINRLVGIAAAHDLSEGKGRYGEGGESQGEACYVTVWTILHVNGRIETKEQVWESEPEARLAAEAIVQDSLCVFGPVALVRQTGRNRSGRVVLERCFLADGKPEWRRDVR